MANLKQGINGLVKEANPNLINFDNKDEFLRKWGLDDLYEFDGGDLWNINYDDNDKEIADYPMTGIRVGYGEPGWDEEKLLQEIESLGRWKRPTDPAAKKLKEAGWSDERLAKAEQGIRQKHPEPKYKAGQYNKKDAWNKQIDEWQKAQPEKKELFDKWRNFDDEKIEFTLALMDLIGGKK